MHIRHQTSIAPPADVSGIAQVTDQTSDATVSAAGIAEVNGADIAATHSQHERRRTSFIALALSSFEPRFMAESF